MVTYKKIADMSGVSESTVSKALSGSGEIAPVTAERIRRIACELGYYRDKRELKRSYSGTFSPHVAIICPEIVSVFYSMLAEALIEKITSFGGRATVMISQFGDKASERIADDVARNPDFDGIISLQKLSNHNSLNIPVVYITSAANIDADCLYCDAGRAIDKLIEYLVDTGHKSLGFIGEMHTVYKEKIFRDSLKERGIKAYEEYIVRSDKRFFNIGREAYRTYVERGVGLPDAVICAYDEVAFGFMSEAMKNGVKIPDDISVVGINNTPFGEVSNPTLTSINSHEEKMAHKAYEILVSRILGSTAEYQTLCYESMIIKRGSVKERGI